MRDLKPSIHNYKQSIGDKPTPNISDDPFIYSYIPNDYACSGLHANAIVASAASVRPWAVV